MTASERIGAEFAALMKAAKAASEDVSDEVQDLIQEGIERPLTKAEARRLLQKIVGVVREHARARGDDDTDEALADSAFIDEVMAARERIGGRGRTNGTRGRKLRLGSWNSIEPGPVFPTPTFHGREVQMNAGFVKVSDISLWDENERLDVHVNQFEEERGRPPTGDELLQIMLSEMSLKGLDKENDQFKIVDLARSIANNGVRRPPIIDVDGTLLDGNRRVAACNYILRSDEFTSEQKKRVERIFVWQLTEHASAEDRDAVVVALNFEPDNKQDWPTYVKARRIYDEFQRLVNLEMRPPSARRLSELKREVARQFALGPNANVVTRYVKMVDIADDFEDYHVNERRRDEFEVKHAATKRFEYFDELSKGASPGGVAHTLGRDDGLKKLAFDLLFDGKFRNFTQIRDLKHVPDNPDMLESLEDAREETHEETAQQKVQDALDIVRSRRAEKRRLGANARIETFIEWLEDLPLSAFRDNVSRKNLEALVESLKLVRGHAVEILGEKHVKELLE